MKKTIIVTFLSILTLISFSQSTTPSWELTLKIKPTAVLTKTVSLTAPQLIINTNTLTIPTGAGSGKVLTSNASGNATWQSLPAGASPTVTITGAGTTSVTASGVGTTTPSYTVTTPASSVDSSLYIHKRVHLLYSAISSDTFLIDSLTTYQIITNVTVHCINTFSTTVNTSAQIGCYLKSDSIPNVVVLSTASPVVIPNSWSCNNTIIVGTTPGHPAFFQTKTKVYVVVKISNSPVHNTTLIQGEAWIYFKKEKITN